ncbi:hypothetical protein [Streptomyces sp. NPDC047070]|uniref:hypothetical protein n=1 Tax=Streptomyces sp. NPDC047070 TaxID=3154923 RepID=UPI003452A727
MTLAILTVDRLPIVDPVTGLRRSGIRHPDGQWRALDGCRWCGDPWFGHGMGRMVASRGQHYWQAPTAAQREARKATYPPVPPAVAPARATCDAMDHDSTGREVFCEIEDPDHTEDHDAGDGITWPRED